MDFLNSTSEENDNIHSSYKNSVVKYTSNIKRKSLLAVQKVCNILSSNESMKLFSSTTHTSDASYYSSDDRVNPNPSSLTPTPSNIRDPFAPHSSIVRKIVEASKNSNLFTASRKIAHQTESKDKNFEVYDKDLNEENVNGLVKYSKKFKSFKDSDSSDGSEFSYKTAECSLDVTGNVVEVKNEKESKLRKNSEINTDHSQKFNLFVEHLDKEKIQMRSIDPLLECLLNSNGDQCLNLPANTNFNFKRKRPSSCKYSNKRMKLEKNDKNFISNYTSEENDNNLRRSIFHSSSPQKDLNQRCFDLMFKNLDQNSNSLVSNTKMESDSLNERIQTLNVEKISENNAQIINETLPEVKDNVPHNSLKIDTESNLRNKYITNLPNNSTFHNSNSNHENDVKEDKHNDYQYVSEDEKEIIHFENTQSIKPMSHGFVAHKKFQCDSPTKTEVLNNNDNVFINKESPLKSSINSNTMLNIDFDNKSDKLSICDNQQITSDNSFLKINLIDDNNVKNATEIPSNSVYNRVNQEIPPLYHQEIPLQIVNNTNMKCNSYKNSSEEQIDLENSNIVSNSIINDNINSSENENVLENLSNISESSIHKNNVIANVNSVIIKKLSTNFCKQLNTKTSPYDSKDETYNQTEIQSTIVIIPNNSDNFKNISSNISNSFDTFDFKELENDINTDNGKFISQTISQQSENMLLQNKNFDDNKMKEIKLFFSDPKTPSSIKSVSKQEKFEKESKEKEIPEDDDNLPEPSKYDDLFKFVNDWMKSSIDPSVYQNCKKNISVRNVLRKQYQLNKPKKNLQENANGIDNQNKFIQQNEEELNYKNKKTGFSCKKQNMKLRNTTLLGTSTENFDLNPPLILNRPLRLEKYVKTTSDAPTTANKITNFMVKRNSCMGMNSIASKKIPSKNKVNQKNMKLNKTLLLSMRHSLKADFASKQFKPTNSLNRHQTSIKKVIEKYQKIQSSMQQSNIFTATLDSSANTEEMSKVKNYCKTNRPYRKAKTDAHLKITNIYSDKKNCSKYKAK